MQSHTVHGTRQGVVSKGSGETSANTSRHGAGNLRFQEAYVSAFVVSHLCSLAPAWVPWLTFAVSQRRGCTMHAQKRALNLVPMRDGLGFRTETCCTPRLGFRVPRCTDKDVLSHEDSEARLAALEYTVFTPETRPGSTVVLPRADEAGGFEPGAETLVNSGWSDLEASASDDGDAAQGVRRLGANFLADSLQAVAEGDGGGKADVHVCESASCAGPPLEGR